MNLSLWKVLLFAFIAVLLTAFPPPPLHADLACEAECYDEYLDCVRWEGGASWCKEDEQDCRDACQRADSGGNQDQIRAVNFGEVYLGEPKTLVYRHTSKDCGRRKCGFRLSWDPPHPSHFSALENGPFFLAYGQSWNLHPGEGQNWAVTFTPDSLGAFSATLYAFEVYDSAVHEVWTYQVSGVGGVPDKVVLPEGEVVTGKKRVLARYQITNAGAYTIKPGAEVEFRVLDPAGEILLNPGFVAEEGSSVTMQSAQ